MDAVEAAHDTPVTYSALLAPGILLLQTRRA